MYLAALGGALNRLVGFGSFTVGDDIFGVLTLALTVGEEFFGALFFGSGFGASISLT